MTSKLTRRKYFWIIPLVFLIACAWQAVVLPTEAPTPTIISPAPTIVSPTPVPASTSQPVIVTPSPLPTEPIVPIITPDTIQIERWREYEDALIEAFFRSYLSPEEAVCEWEIMGRTEQEVYVYAYCAGIYSSNPSQASIPAVIHIRMDGSVESAEIPGAGTSYGPDIRRMFPSDVQERIFGRSIYFQEMADRLRWRRGHPDEPPWVVLSSLSIQPTQPAIPVIRPDPVQVWRWKEYQTALAKGFLSYLRPERVICEWELLGQSGQEVWAICAELGGVGTPEGLAIIHIGEDGSAISAETRIDFPSEIQQRFPLDVQERYFGGLIHFQELVDHLRWRQRHQAELPLVVLGITPTP